MCACKKESLFPKALIVILITSWAEDKHIKDPIFYEVPSQYKG